MILSDIISSEVSDLSDMSEVARYSHPYHRAHWDMSEITNYKCQKISVDSLLVGFIHSLTIIVYTRVIYRLFPVRFRHELVSSQVDSCPDNFIRRNPETTVSPDEARPPKFKPR